MLVVVLVVDMAQSLAVREGLAELDVVAAVEDSVEQQPVALEAVAVMGLYLYGRGN